MTELTRAPNLAALYAKAVATAPTRRGTALPETEYVRNDIAVDTEHLAAYNRVCGFDLRNELPVTYPHMLSFALSVQLMTDPGFPFALVGLVHVANTITQVRPLTVTDSLSQRVWLENLRPHPRGKQFDAVTETSVDGEVVWREASTYLRRGKSDDAAPRPAAVADIEPGAPIATWRLPGDLGRRYAAVSGDRNPIHLNRWAAKAFGFPRAIAHGMWLKARCLGALAARLPGSGTVRIEFRRPALLPSTVDFTARGAGTEWEFALHNRSGKTHVLGSVAQ